MKKLFLILAPAALMAGCSKELVITPPPAIEEEVTSEIPQRNVENALYNELTDSWMIPQADPYTLENFQKAYDNLASGKSLQTLTRAETEELFEPGVKLEPTHYALRIYPKTEEEQWNVEMMDDVSVVYSPFNYSGLTQEEIERVPQTRSEIPSPFEKSPYTVTYDNQYVTDGGSTAPVTYQLPIMYTVWPIGKPLPEDLEYVVDYEVFLPKETSTTRSADAMFILENEAVSTALGIAPVSMKPATRSVHLSVNMTLKTYDDVLGKNIPLVNLTILGRVGTNIKETVTDSNGKFSIAMNTIPMSSVMSLYPVYKSSSGLWNITPGNYTTIPYEGPRLIGMVGSEYSIIGNSYWGEKVLPSGDHQENVIHRAVNYFFNGQTVFPKNVPLGGLMIIANNTSGGNTNGSYNPESRDITIYNNNSTNGSVIGTTLHEIGHYIHHRTQSTIFDSSPRKEMLLIESFAPYVGWNLGEAYYKSLGWVQPSGASDITGQALQGWKKTYTLAQNGHYSPLFVDLTDNYNQRTMNADYLYDDIQGMQPSAIWNIVKTSPNWAQCRDKIKTALVTEAYLEDFDYWISKNYRP